MKKHTDKSRLINLLWDTLLFLEETGISKAEYNNLNTFFYVGKFEVCNFFSILAKQA